MNKRLALFLSVFFFCTIVNAEAESERDNYLKIKDVYNKVDAELNSVYKQQMQEYKNEGAGFYEQIESKDVYLKKSQIAWIRMRDASCDYETYESRTGTAFSSIYEKCLLEKTKERIRYLKENN